MCLYSCLRYTACKPYFSALYYVVICDLSGSPCFSTLSHKRHDFPKKKKMNIIFDSREEIKPSTECTYLGTKIGQTGDNTTEIKHRINP